MEMPTNCKSLFSFIQILTVYLLAHKVLLVMNEQTFAFILIFELIVEVLCFIDEVNETKRELNPAGKGYPVIDQLIVMLERRLARFRNSNLHQSTIQAAGNQRFRTASANSFIRRWQMRSGRKSIRNRIEHVISSAIFICLVIWVIEQSIIDLNGMNLLFLCKITYNIRPILFILFM